MKKADMVREMLERRFKNRKIDVDEASFSKYVKKRGYKSIIDFYVEIELGNIDANEVIDGYAEFIKPVEQILTHETADKFVLQSKVQDTDDTDSDILIIGNDVKGINYKFSKCCNPIYGDKIMGFISSSGAIKIHRMDCGNVKNLMEKFPYRVQVAMVGQTWQPIRRHAESSRAGRHWYRYQHHFAHQQGGRHRAAQHFHQL